jgi:hypothetical protein
LTLSADPIFLRTLPLKQIPFVPARKKHEQKMMRLAVFHEFSNTKLLNDVAAAGFEVDQAAAPNALATSDAEKQLVATNAKLFFDAATPEADVMAAVEKLKGFGFTVEKLFPTTSAGCPMLDRVILTAPSA